MPSPLTDWGYLNCGSSKGDQLGLPYKFFGSRFIPFANLVFQQFKLLAFTACWLTSSVVANLLILKKTGRSEQQFVGKYFNPWASSMSAGAGGTNGGIGQFFVGLALSGIAAYLFFDSVHVSTAPSGWISGLIGGNSGGLSTVSAGLLFLPFFIGVMALFVNAKQTWAWIMTWAGLGILAVEILSRLRFFMEMKLTHLLILIALMAAGCGLIFRSFRDFAEMEKNDKKDTTS